jgi:hypothetical protein
MDNVLKVRRILGSHWLRIGLVLAALAPILNVPVPSVRADIVPIPSDTVPHRSLTVHGPIDVGPAELAAVTQTAGAGSTATDDDGSPVPCLVDCSPPASTDEGTLPQSPKAQPSYVADSSIGVGDPTIAASDSYVMVSSNVAIATYNKAGQLLHNSTNFPNPFYTQCPSWMARNCPNLFTPLFADIEANTTYPVDVPTNFDKSFGLVGDTRVLFDPFRKRFFVAAVAQNRYMTDVIFDACFTNHKLTPGDTCAAQCSADGKRGCSAKQLDEEQLIKNFSGLRIVWRQKVVVAVSKTQDPGDGFYLYWWDAVINDGHCTHTQGCPDEPTFGPGTSSGTDYPMFGLSRDHFLTSMAVGLAETDATKAPAINLHFRTYWDCWRGADEGKDAGPCHKQLYTNLMTVPAEQLTNPCHSGICPFQRLGYSFGVFAPYTSQVPYGMTKIIRPVMHHSSVPDGGVFFTNPHMDPACVKVASASHRSSLVVSKITFPPNADPVFWQTEVPVADSPCPVALGGTSSYRNGRLYAAWEECGAQGCRSRIHMVRLNPFVDAPAQDASTFQDRAFGTRNVFDDASNTAERSYQFPAIDVNKGGNMAIVYTRHATDLPQEARFTVRYADDADVRPSRILHYGHGTTEPAERAVVGTDTAGIAVDPFDDDGIWMAHVYAKKAPDEWRIAYGKVFGLPFADLSISSMALDRPSAKPGDSFHIRGDVLNGGDGAAGPSTATIYLSSDPQITSADTVLGRVSIQRIASGGRHPINPKVQIPANLPGGDYFLGALVQQDSGREYSTENNASPILESDPRLHIDGPPCRECAPAIGVTPEAMTFTGTEGGIQPSNQPLSITNTATGTLNWSAADNASWLSVSPTSGTAPSTVNVSANTAGLRAGTYSGVIAVTASGATNSPTTVPVTLNVVPRS